MFALIAWKVIQIRSMKMKIKCGGHNLHFFTHFFVSPLLLAISLTANALGPIDVPPTWGGDFATRQRLTGDWGGVRGELGRKGVVLEADVFLHPQGVVTGGNETEAEFWGNIDYSLNIDTGKMGLWPGGFFKFEGITSFGNTLTSAVGSLVPSDVSVLFPGINEADSGLMGASFTQFLSPKFGVMMGKMNLFDFTATEFYGDYHSQFMNTSLNFSMAYTMVPMSAYGGGILILPTENITLAAMALDANGTPTENDIGNAFDEGTTVVGSASIKIEPFGLVGHQSLTGVWSDKSHFSLEQDPSNIGRALLNERFPRLANPGPILYRILEKFYPELPVPTQPADKKDETWAVIYGFDQYFWQPDDNPKHGIGVFFSFGATDGNPNPIEYSYLMGVGGKGVIPGRANDSFGIGWARTQFSDQLVPFLRERLDLGLNHEDAIELYYNAAVTSWLELSPNIQIIDSGINKQLDENGKFKKVDTAVVTSLRVNIRL